MRVAMVLMIAGITAAPPSRANAQQNPDDAARLLQNPAVRMA